MPLVSIVLPTLNGHRFVAASIDSCLRQTHGDLELIVVDGGSTDGTLEVAAGYRDARLTVIHQLANTGRLPGALNLGFARAAGEYFTWTQADDYYTPDAIATLSTYLGDNPQVGLVYAGFRFVDASGAVVDEYLPRPPEAIYRSNPVGHCFLYRRRVAEITGEYDPGYSMAEDAHYWMRVYSRFPMAPIASQHCYHRRHPDSLTSRDYGAYRALRVAARARREVLGIGWREYQRQLAAAFVEEAFAAHARGDRSRVRMCLLRGLGRDPTWWRNRGVLSIAVQSLGRARTPRVADEGAAGRQPEIP